MPRLIVSVSNDLVTDQRVKKVCQTLSDEGYDILLIGRELPQSPPIERPYQTHRFKLFFNTKAWFFAELNIRLFFKLLFVKKDVLLANDLDTLLANYLVSRITRTTLVYDSHELFTELPELTGRPFVKNVWLTIEKFIFPKLKNVITVSDSISLFYKKKYNQSVYVIKNVPEFYKLPKKELKSHQIVLYQGSINQKRGLDLMIDTIEKNLHWKLYIAGDGYLAKHYKELIRKRQLENQIFFLGRFLPKDLREITLKASVGLSLEEDYGLNYHYALPNKLFDYIMAEVPVIVSDLPEMKRIIEEFNLGIVLKDRSITGLSKAIEEILSKPKEYWEFEKAKNKYNWENEAQKLRYFYNNLK